MNDVFGHDWRDDAAYDLALSFTRDAFAWEGVRRNPDYHSDWMRSRRAQRHKPDLRSQMTVKRLRIRQAKAEAWGLYAFRRS